MQDNSHTDYCFEWDDEKNHINIKKHGISFESARFVFADENHVILYDDIHSVNEERYIAIGMVDKILYVVHTIRNERIRIISARTATEAERRIYYDGLF